MPQGSTSKPATDSALLGCVGELSDWTLSPSAKNFWTGAPTAVLPALTTTTASSVPSLRLNANHRSLVKSI